MGFIQSLREGVEERLGLTVIDRAEALELRENTDLLAQREAELDMVGYDSFNYAGGRPQEMRYDRRQRVAARARTAYAEDPLAFREIEMTADFVFGRGVGVPRAKSKKLQKVIDRAWKDPNNQDKLTGFEAQRALVVDMKTQANIFITRYTQNGRIRVGFLDHDTVETIVSDPEDRHRDLWYLVAKRIEDWDFETDTYAVSSAITEAGRRKIEYWPHWRNVEIAREERKERKETALKEPPDEKLVKDVGVYHMRMFRWSESRFGISPFTRHIRFLSAFNKFLETRITMAQASAAFIARKSVKGTPRQITRVATNMVAQLGELGQQQAPPRFDPAASFPSNPMVGGIQVEDAMSRTEALSLNSGAGNAAQDAQVLRSPISAASGWGQHYIGDASNANLASATTLELPALLMTRSWQEMMDQMYRWFTDSAIEAAVRNGEFPDTVIPDGEAKGTTADTLSEAQWEQIEWCSPEARKKPITELRLWEEEDLEVAKVRTGLDFDYEFTMPYPLRREMGEVTTLVQSTLDMFDTDRTNRDLQRVLMNYLFAQAYEIDNPAKLVEEVMPEEADAPPVDPNATPPPDPNAQTVPPPAPTPADASQYGEVTKATAPEDVPMAQAEWLPPELRAKLSDFTVDLTKGFDNDVAAHAILAGAKLGGNGAGPVNPDEAT